MLSYLLPTHDRPRELANTLAALATLSAEAHDRIGGAEVVIVDNASATPVRLSGRLSNGLHVRVVRLESNLGAAGRNAGAQIARGDWLVMLDDDSSPLNEHHIEVLLDAPPDVVAIGAEIALPSGERESGGLPEVFIGCGAAVRREAFLAVGGYDPAFDYYAEEYDLCARLILDGWRVVHDLRFKVRHEKSASGRDMNRIVQRLVRNNGWVVQRYAPAEAQTAELAGMIARYSDIAVRQSAAKGFAAGMAELLDPPAPRSEDPCVRRRRMCEDLYARFTGLAHARTTLAREFAPRNHDLSVAIVDEGKGAAIVRRALTELGATLVADPARAEVLVIGTLSPGPMLDAYDRRQGSGQDVILPWIPAGQLLPLGQPATIS